MFLMQISNWQLLVWHLLRKLATNERGTRPNNSVVDMLVQQRWPFRHLETPILAKRTFAPLRQYTHLGQTGLERAWRCTKIVRLCAIHKLVPIGGHYYYSG
ncbi:unnamed protein product [Ixodes persulcatus]